MNQPEDLAHLHAQRAIVEEQLARLRPEQRLMRINLESRLRMIDEEIAACETVAMLDRRARAVLTFGGKPVVGAGAIEATFGADALQAFQRLVSTTAATREGRKLSARGRIPDEESYRLYITGTSPGSFSFELGEMVVGDPQDEPSILYDAVEQASALLQATQMDDEPYADAVAESNPRVIKALEDFLGLMESREATLRLAVRERECVFDTPEVVARAAERARRTNITDATEPVRGVLTGVFAKGRRFEFELKESGEVISGRISHDIHDPSSLKPYLWTPSVAYMWIVTTERAGDKRRTYYLNNVEPLGERG